MIEDFIKELEGNQKINKKRGYENRVDIDYVIERLEDIKIQEELTEEYLYFYKELAENQNKVINILCDRLKGSDNNGS